MDRAMTLAFRNIDVTPDDPVSKWHSEGIQAALERGDLTHWRRIAAEVQQDPFGQVAQELSEVLTYSRPYGIADVMADVLAHARSAARDRERAEVAAEVRSLINNSGLTNQALAARIGTSPSRLSSYATGRVVPSAAMMVRMRRLLDRAVNEVSDGCH
ncbi:MAG: helix-turn-helix domain-containing protein [Actinobacteria bacterium]|nr:helix-turn-helix domain-containing protein [Actinomycetota bacterium]